MLRAGSSLKGYNVEASDGGMGTVHDFMFDDTTWKMRWMVVDTGNWLSGRRVLIHPSAIGLIDDVGGALQINLPRATIEAAPGILTDRPVSMQQEKSLYDYYDWDPAWGGSLYGQGTMVADLEPVMYFDRDTLRGAAGNGFHLDEGDPHLRSFTEILNYHLTATDDAIGHIENVLIDDNGWLINYLIVDTSNWWMGQHVLISPHAVTKIDFSAQKIKVNITQEQIKASPPWKPTELIDAAYKVQLDRYYDWPSV